MTLRQLLLDKGYKRIKLTKTTTNHLEVKADLNGVSGVFILDTGASNSCVGFDAIDHFLLFAEDSEIKAAGAGATDMLTQVSQKNVLDIGGRIFKGQSLVLFDLTHVNTALETHNADTVHGIIGADVLKKGKAVIDYERLCLYLK